MTAASLTSEPEKLLPCPFCGGEAKRFTVEEEGDNFGGDVIACTGMCGASSHVEFGRKENLASLWNTRLSSPVSGTDMVSEAFRPIATWDQRDEPVMLLVDYADGDHPLDDARFAITIGHSNDHNVGEGEGQGWLFAGWCWSHDHYVQGKGEVVGWMPLPHILARAWAAFDGEPAASPTPPIPMIAEAGEREGLSWRLERLIEDGGPLTLSDKGVIREAIAALSTPTPATLDNTAAPEPWWTDAGSVAEARRVFQEGRRALLHQKSINTHLRGVYEPIIAALEPMLSTLAHLDTGKAATHDNTAVEGQEPFGYWVEQRYAEPVLLREPAYIPEPSEHRTVTPLYATLTAKTEKAE